MFSIGVEFLGGVYTAASFDDRQSPEWPLHPARLFSAMVATFEGAEPDPSSRAALEWLESQPPPLIRCSGPGQVRERLVATHFVPGNDSVARPKAIVGSHASVLPEARDRQARYYPALRPDSPLVAFEWENAQAPDDIAAALRTLLDRVGRVGHSSSLVRCAVATYAWLVDDPGVVAYRPFDGMDEAGSLPVRVMVPGLLAELKMAFRQHGGIEPRALPAAFVSYSQAEAAPPPAVRSPTAGDWIVFPLDGDRGPRLRITRGVEATRALRAAIMSHADNPIPDLISGHGDPSAFHAMWLALPNAGTRHGDGYVGGLAVALPTRVGVADRESLLTAIGRLAAAGSELAWHGGRLALRPARADRVGMSRDGRVAVTAQRQYWAGRSREWASVTPIALDRFPKSATDAGREDGRFAEEVGSTIARSCTAVGLPTPAGVEIIEGPPITGVPPVGPGVPDGRGGARFAFFRAGGSGQLRYCVHARVIFADEVGGPIVLGAGRHFGYGLMAAWRDAARQ